MDFSETVENDPFVNAGKVLVLLACFDRFKRTFLPCSAGSSWVWQVFVFCRELRKEGNFGAQPTLMN